MFSNPTLILVGLMTALLTGFVTGWKVESWKNSSKELVEQQANYKNLESEFVKYQAESQNKIDEFKNKLDDEVNRNLELRKKSEEIVAYKQNEIHMAQGQTHALQKMLLGLQSTNCDIDDVHQQLLDDISKAANRQPRGSGGSPKDPPTRNTNKFDTTVSRTKE